MLRSCTPRVLILGTTRTALGSITSRQPARIICSPRQKVWNHRCCFWLRIDLVLCINSWPFGREGEKLLVALVGLPNSGKTLIARKISRSVPPSFTTLFCQCIYNALRCSTIAESSICSVNWSSCHPTFLPLLQRTYTSDTFGGSLTELERFPSRSTGTVL